jgi:hypothetical protein
MPDKPTLDDVTDGSTRKLADYLPLTGGTLTGSLGIINSDYTPLAVQSTYPTCYLAIRNNSGDRGSLAYRNNIKIFGINSNDNKIIGLNSKGKPVYHDGSEHSIWHEGNDGHGSGLNADKLDGEEGTYYAAASDVNTLKGYFTYGVANDADKLDGFHAYYTDFLYSYSDYKSLSRSAISGDFWYAKIVLERSYDASKSAIVLKSNYSNIAGVVYLNLLSHNDGFNAYVTNYNGCNIVGISTSYENNKSVIYLKLKKPVGSGDNG